MSDPPHWTAFHVLSWAQSSCTGCLYPQATQGVSTMPSAPSSGQFRGQPGSGHSAPQWESPESLSTSWPRREMYFSDLNILLPLFPHQVRTTFL